MATNSIVADFEAWQTALFSALVKATKAANAIPAGDVNFYRTLDRSFAADMDDASTATLDLCNGLLQQAGGSAVEELKDADDMTDRFDIITDVVDNMLEKVDVAIDEMKSPRKKGSAVIPQSAPVVALAKTDKLEYKLIHAQNIARPQLRFPDPVDNSQSPFIRKITYKPNAKVDLNYGLDRLTAATDSSSESSDVIVQPHPYEYEINHLEYPQHMFEQRPEQLYHPFDTTTATWVDTEEALKDMCKTLEMQREIAIDLEHHNYRSFQGFVCLMQISTRDQDYVVDTLELRGSLHLLNQSFTDPSIVKVLHGADSDIIWLQRDFGVYIVNLFDTFNASKLLELGAHSLAHLLKLYCNYDADKRYQLADWRIRPLPKEMFNYARSDTHFLLYIYDRMRNALLDKSNPTTHNLIHAALLRSSQTSLKVHEKEVYDAEGGDGPNGWRNMYSKWNRALNNLQFAVFKALHAWRDQTARDEDESLRYVLPNHMLFTLAERMPEEAANVLGCCNPVPPPVKMNASDIAMLISRTKASVAPVLGSLKQVSIDVPVHVRFDPKTGLQGTQEITKPTQDGPSTVNIKSSTPLEKAAAAAAQSGKVIAAARSGMFGNSAVHAPASGEPIADPTPLMATRSGLFGQLTSSKTSKAEEEGREIAKRIMQQLSNKPAEPAPVFRELTQLDSAKAVAVQDAPAKTEEEQKAAEKAESQEVLFTPEQERVTKQKRTDVLVLSSMSKKRSRAIDEERAELAKEEAVSAAGTSTHTSDAEGAEEAASDAAVMSVKKKNKKAKKDKKARSLSSASATPSSSAAASGDEQVSEAFQPFDYNSVRSVVDENIASMTSGKRKPRKKKGGEGSSAEPAKPFDPYSQMVEGAEFKKKDATFSRNPKSGARSMTFGKN
ncbi:exosome nuclease subunit [Mortierella claussenii]|nr:exosome nuclease subunit [Mortierella claussenii]